MRSSDRSDFKRRNTISRRTPRINLEAIRECQILDLYDGRLERPFRQKQAKRCPNEEIEDP